MNDPARNPYTKPSSALQRGPISNGLGQNTINATAITGGIISFALICGVLMMSTCLVFFMSGLEEGQEPIRFDGDALIFVVVGYAVFIASAVAAVFIRSLMKRQAIAEFKAADEELPQPLEGDSTLPPSAQRFLGTVSTYTLIGQAMMEGPAVINLVLLFIESNYAHVVPVVLGIIGIALQVQTVGRLQSLIRDAKQHL